MSDEQRKIMGEELPEAKPSKPNPEADMGFLDHLEELRWRIIKGVVGIFLGVIVAFIFNDFFINDILLGPTQSSFFVYDHLRIDAVDLSLQNRKLPGQFFTYWGTLIVVGAIIGAPIFFYQLYMFVEPALEKTEKSKAKYTVSVISFLFICGVLFGYLLLTPFALQFFTQFQLSDLVRNDFDINEYFSTMSMWILACGIIFQMPMVTWFLSNIGMLTPDFMIKYRRHAIVFCFILGAFLTPPDPLSQLILAIPLISLYQLSIYISRVANRRRDKKIWGEGGKHRTMD